MDKFKRWFTVFIIGMAGGMSFELPYIRYNYEEPMKALMGYSHTQLGAMLSLYGLVSIVFYFFSGILADKYSHKILISGGMILTGALGFVMMAYPPYWVALVVELLWAVTTVLIMWSATIKAVSLLGSPEEQGSLFGLAEGSRGFGCLWTAFFTLWLFSRVGALNNPNSIKVIFLAYGIIFILTGILCWFLVPNGYSTAKDKTEHEHISVKDVINVMKLKTTWYCSLVIFGVYVVFSILSYTTSYLVGIFAMPVVTATVIGMIRNQVFRTVGGPIGGLITAKTKLKSPTTILLICGSFTIVGLILLLVIPASAKLLGVMIAIVLMLALFNYISRGMYFACIGEVKTPARVRGTTIGICSVVGFIPDAFIYILIGHWQDTLPAATAYRYMWICGVMGTLIVFVFGGLLYKEIKRRHSIVDNAKATLGA